MDSWLSNIEGDTRSVPLAARRCSTTSRPARSTSASSARRSPRRPTRPPARPRSRTTATRGSGRRDAGRQRDGSAALKPLDAADYNVDVHRRSVGAAAAGVPRRRLRLERAAGRLQEASIPWLTYDGRPRRQAARPRAEVAPGTTGTLKQGLGGGGTCRRPQLDRARGRSRTPVHRYCRWLGR